LARKCKIESKNFARTRLSYYKASMSDVAIMKRPQVMEGLKEEERRDRRESDMNGREKISAS
jgi:hypothetical protein